MSSSSDQQSYLTFNSLIVGTDNRESPLEQIQQQVFSPNLVPYGLYPLPMAPPQDCQQNSDQREQHGIEGHQAHYFLPVYKLRNSAAIPISQTHAKKEGQLPLVLDFINKALMFLSVIMIIIGTGVAVVTPIVAFLASKTPLVWNMTEIEAVCFVAYIIFTILYHGAIAVTGILGIVSAIRRNFRFRITAADLYFKSLIRLLVVSLLNAAVAPTLFRMLHFGLGFLYLEELSWSVVILGIISLFVLNMCTFSCLIACAGVNLWRLRQEEKRRDREAILRMMERNRETDTSMIEPNRGQTLHMF